MSSTLDRFDEVIGGATNDELIELEYRLIEELTDRAGTVTRIALESGDRDIENEAATYVGVVDEMFPFMASNKRIHASSRYVDKCKEELRDAIEARSSGEETTSGAFRAWKVGKSPAAKRHEEAEQARKDREEEALLERVDLSRGAVLEAFRAAVSETGMVQARDVALALCPDATDPDTPGRQKIIARVGAEIRRLAAEGLVVKAIAGDGNHKTARWALGDG
jgi:hypothetical protein